MVTRYVYIIFLRHTSLPHTLSPQNTSPRHTLAPPHMRLSVGILDLDKSDVHVLLVSLLVDQLSCLLEGEQKKSETDQKKFRD